MKLNYFLLCLLILNISKTTFAQINYKKTAEYLNANKYWPLSPYRGISFFDGTLKKDTSAFDMAPEASTAICHPITGKLLFYAKYNQIYNAKHQAMPNGDISSLMNNSSSAYSALIVPYIADSNLYYFFHYNYSNNSANRGSKVYYSIIDMRLNNGDGGIVDGKKLVVLDSNMTGRSREGLEIFMGESCDLWLIATSMESSNWQLGTSHLRAYHITESGIDSIPVISELKTQAFWSKLATSSDQELIVHTGWLASGVEFLTFNKQTGKFTTKYEIPLRSGWLIGGIGSEDVRTAAFSPDNSKLYVNYGGGLSNVSSVAQLDLSKDHPDSIFNSLQVIHNNYTNSLRLYNDTLYGYGYTTNGSLLINFIDRYTNLNGSATNIVYDSSLINFDGVRTSTTVLPQDVVYPTQFIISTLDTQFCETEFIFSSSDKNGEQYIWNDGTTENTKMITESGIYWVQSKKRNQHCFTYISDTFHVTFLPAIEEPIISVNESELSTQQQANATYQWMLSGTDINGATDYKYVVTQNGNYQVRVTSTQAGECTNTSTVYTVNNQTSIEDMAENAIAVYPNPMQDNISIRINEAFKAEMLDAAGRTLFTTSEKQINLQSLANGIYQIQIYDLNGKVLFKTKITKQ